MRAQRCDDLRLTGSAGANRVMEAELKRLVMRSPFQVRVEKPKREGEAAQQDVRALDPDYVERMLPGASDMKPGVFCFNPPYGVRMGAEEGQDKLLALYSDLGRAFARFKDWRAACFVANPRFVDAFGHAPVMTKPGSNADLRGAFLVFEL